MKVFHVVDALPESSLKSILYRNIDVNEIMICGLVFHGCVKSMCLGGLRSGLKLMF